MKWVEIITLRSSGKIKCLIAGRLQRDESLEDVGLTMNQLLRQAKIDWHGVKLNQPDWGADSHAIAFTLRSPRGRFMIHIMVNAYWEQLTFEVQPIAESASHDWMRWIDTARESPDDICNWDEAVPVLEPLCPVQPRSLVVRVAWLMNHENAKADASKKTVHALIPISFERRNLCR